MYKGLTGNHDEEYVRSLKPRVKGVQKIKQGVQDELLSQLKECAQIENERGYCN